MSKSVSSLPLRRGDSFLARGPDELGVRFPIRKKVAQVGVLLFVFANFEGMILPFIPYSGYIVVPLVGFGGSWIFVLLLAACLPSNKEEKWGSIWPLSGYDNAIDAIYTRGPWLMRFQELDEFDRERGVSTGMITIFGEDQA